MYFYSFHTVFYKKNPLLNFVSSFFLTLSFYSIVRKMLEHLLNLLSFQKQRTQVRKHKNYKDIHVQKHQTLLGCIYHHISYIYKFPQDILIHHLT